MNIEKKFYRPAGLPIAVEVSTIFNHTENALELNSVIKILKDKKANLIGYSKDCKNYGPFQVDDLVSDNYILQKTTLHETLLTILNKIPRDYIPIDRIYNEVVIIQRKITIEAEAVDDIKLYLFNKSYATYKEQLEFGFDLNQFDYFFSIILISTSEAYFITIWYD